MRLLESQVEKSACQYAKDRGWFERKLQFLGRDGAPDRIFIRRGRVVFIEFKRPGRDVIPGGPQDRTREAITKQGVEAYVVDTIEEAKAILK